MGKGKSRIWSLCFTNKCSSLTYEVPFISILNTRPKGSLDCIIFSIVPYFCSLSSYLEHYRLLPCFYVSFDHISLFDCLFCSLNARVDGNTVHWRTQIERYQNESSTFQKVESSNFDSAELESLFIRGTYVDAFFSLETFDYMEKAGIGLVADKLIILHQWFGHSSLCYVMHYPPWVFIVRYVTTSNVLFWLIYCKIDMMPCRKWTLLFLWVYQVLTLQSLQD